MTTIDIDTIHLESGAHDSPESGMCAMEMAAYIADWLARTQLPAWLDLAGLGEHASAVRAIIAISSADTAHAAQPSLAAAWAAAGAAAWDAAGAKLKPTVTALQQSAFDLLDRMIAL